MDEAEYYIMVLLVPSLRSMQKAIFFAQELCNQRSRIIMSTRLFTVYPMNRVEYGSSLTPSEMETRRVAG
jgi:hypothetical protein